jgi:hypothetical protein
LPLLSVPQPSFFSPFWLLVCGWIEEHRHGCIGPISFVLPSPAIILEPWQLTMWAGTERHLHRYTAGSWATTALSKAATQLGATQCH